MKAIKHIDYLGLFLSAVSLAVSLFDFYTIAHPEEMFPFTKYLQDTGIRTIIVCKFCLLAVMTAIFVNFAIRKMITNRMWLVLICAILLLCGLMWTELWWGSTFYYGEIRDKQGLIFPYGSLIWLAYIIWSIRLPFNFDNWFWRLFATAVVICILWIIWSSVQEPWKLWQS